MVIYENLYKPGIIAKEEDQYPTSSYELEGYIAYSWGKNVPKIKKEIEKSKLQYEANHYIHSICITCSQFMGTLVFHHTIGDFKNVIVNGMSITFTGNAGVYLVPVDWTNRADGEPDLTFNYIVIIYPDKDRNEMLKVQEYLEQEDNNRKLLNQFKSSVELWKEQQDSTTSTYYTAYHYSEPYYSTSTYPYYSGQQITPNQSSEEP